MVYRSSFSQFKNFRSCQYSWYLEKIKKIKTEVDTCYMDLGNVVHHSLDNWYSKKINDINILKEFFEKEWTSYKLDNTKLKERKDNTWEIIIKGIEYNFFITSTELKIFYDEFLGYFDIVDTANHIIRDWKTSTRTKETDDEYKKQLLLYAYFYKKKFGSYPVKLEVIYLKDDSLYNINFTEKDIINIAEDYYKSLQEMQDIIDNKKTPIKCAECYYFCPYKTFCKEGNDYIIEINGWYCKTNFDDEVLEKHLVKKFSYELKNHIYIKKKYPQFNTTKSLYDIKYKSFPLGILSEVKKTLNDYIQYKNLNKKVYIIDNRKVLDYKKINMPISLKKQLRDYQKEAVDCYINSANERNILNIATGGGKTLIGIELVRHYNVNTLIIIERIELLKQIKEEIEKELDIECGIINGKKIDIKQISIATIQTLNSKKAELKEYLNNIEFCWIDEAHHAPANTYYTLNKYINNVRHILLTSGTAYREDGLDILLNAVGGYIIKKITTEELINSGYLIKPEIYFIEVDSGLIEKDIRKKIIEDLYSQGINPLDEKNKIIVNNMLYNEFIISLEQRNNLLDIILKVNKNKQVLVLVKNIKHGELLSIKYNVPYIHGSLKKDERENIYNNFINKKINVIIGTYSIFSEGIDIKELDAVINMTANSGSIKTIQILGRILRKSDNKNNAIYYDFLDKDCYLFKRASFKRISSFKQQNHKINIIKKDNIYI